MTRFWREGHWRYSSLGTRHWVEGHWVDRVDWWSSWSYSPVASRSLSATIGRFDSWVDPNARCPRCGAEVFFYSNEFGSRVYFDDLGPPWPKHPCMDTSATYVSISSAVSVPTANSGVRDLITRDSMEETTHVPGVFVVRAVEKRGPKRMVTLEEIGGERIEILVSPPAPPVHAIAVSRVFELHWFDPQTGSKGKNLVWRRT